MNELQKAGLIGLDDEEFLSDERFFRLMDFTLKTNMIEEYDDYEHFIVYFDNDINKSIEDSLKTKEITYEYKDKGYSIFYMPIKEGMYILMLI